MLNLRDLVLANALFGGNTGGSSGGGGSAEEWIGDGKTHLWIKIATEGRMDVPLVFNQTVTDGVIVDWGDGSAPETFSKTGRVQTTHTYANIGEYCITLDAVDGCTLTLTFVMGITGKPEVYKNMLQKAEIGDSVKIGDSAFNGCYSLASVTIPDSVTSIGSGAFSSCYSLASVTIPDSVTSIGGNAFYSCYSLASVTIPDGVTSIGEKGFYYCYSLASVTIPDSVTSIGDSAFVNCYSLASVTIPDSVTSIGSGAFSSCRGLGKVRFDGTTPPTVANSNAFFSLPTDCIISVPVGCLDAYKTATNYPAPATYTYIEE